MAKVLEVLMPDTRAHYGWMVRCPASDCYAHVFDGRWSFNGDKERPTFHGSMLSTTPRGSAREKMVCHSFVKDGRIQFLGDCTHELKGQTVDLPDWEDG